MAQDLPTAPVSSAPEPAPRRGWRTLAIVALGFAAGYLAWRISRQTAEPADLGPAFQYDLGSLKKANPGRLGYREIRRLDTGMKEVRGMALAADGSIWVAGDRALKHFDPQGAVTQTIDLPDPPRCLALAGDRLYVSLPGRIEVCTPADGRLQIWRTLETGGYVTSLAVVGGDLLVADSGRRTVYRCAADGRPLQSYGGGDVAGRPGLVVPSPYLDVDVEADGRIAINNPGRHRVETYSADGDPVDHWGRAAMTLEGFSGCCNPVAIAHLADGRMVTAEKGLARVKLHSPEGKLLCLVAAPDSFAADGFAIDLATDAAGHVFVLDTSARAVREFEALPAGVRP